MENTLSQKTHYLNKSMRYLMIGCGLLVWIIPLLPFMVHATDPGSAKDFAILFGLVTCLSLPCLIYAFGCRLVTTNEGIKNYSSFPFYSFIAWKDVLQIKKGGLGSVILIAAPKVSRKTHRTIAISTFIENWSKSELVSEIKKYAPHIVFPQEIYDRKEVPFLYRSGTLLLYLVISTFFVLILNGFLPIGVAQKYSEITRVIGVGGILAALGGMEGLLWFGEWRDAQPGLNLVKKLAIIFYCVPFLGMAIAYVIHYTFKVFAFLPEELETAGVMLLCFMSLRIFIRIFGKYFLFSNSRSISSQLTTTPSTARGRAPHLLRQAQHDA